MNRFLRFCLVTLSGLWFFAGCKKHYIKKHYTGTFEFTSHLQQWQPSPYDTTTVFQGEITFVEKDWNGYVIKIPAYPALFIEAYVNKNGELAHAPYIDISLSGSFTDNDHVSFVYTEGSDHSFEVTGVRK
jgi:hypothetical protein